MSHRSHLRRTVATIAAATALSAAGAAAPAGAAVSTGPGAAATGTSTTGTSTTGTSTTGTSTGTRLAPRAARRSPSLIRVTAADLGQLARRSFDSQLVYPCNKHVMTWVGDQLKVLADLGGGEQMDEVELVRTLRTAGFTWAEMPDAVVVVAGESALCPRAFRNNYDALTGALRSTDVGLWQINTTFHPEYASWNLKDPLVASRAAKRIKDRYGWTPWHAYANRDAVIGYAMTVVDKAKAAGVL